MKKPICLLLCALLLAMMLGGCVDIAGYFRGISSLFGYNQIVAYSDMVYTRPDPAVCTQAVEDATQLAGEDDLDALLEGIYRLNWEYNDYYTNMSLAYIHYCADLTDTYWSQEYNYCAEGTTELSAALDQFYTLLAAGPHREALESEAYFGPGYFDDYAGDSLWDETFTALNQQETELINHYYTLSAQDYTRQTQLEMGSLFLELVQLRREIAAYAGYDTYTAYAYDTFYDRDFTPQQARSYLDEIRQELVPLYRRQALEGSWDFGYTQTSTADTRAFVSGVSQAMGELVAEAYQVMDQYGLNDIGYAPNKYDASFETYLYTYEVPFVFLNPTGTIRDHLTFAHEFGHFANDYASYGMTRSIDVAEFFSQGMEYLSLFYGTDTQELTAYKLCSSLSVYVEQSAYAYFEELVYAADPQDLTQGDIAGLFQRAMEAYGLDVWDIDPMDYVSVTHFFTNPVYIISYVVSNDAAMQLYLQEQAQTGMGLATYLAVLDTPQTQFLAFLEEAGLESPFTPGRLSQVAQTLQTGLGF